MFGCDLRAKSQSDIDARNYTNQEHEALICHRGRVDRKLKRARNRDLRHAWRVGLAHTEVAERRARAAQDKDCKDNPKNHDTWKGDMN